jgi:hypothetical protein
MPEPRDPLLKVLMIKSLTQTHYSDRVPERFGGRGPGGRGPPATGDRPQWARRGNAVTVNTGGRLGSLEPALSNDPSAGSPTETLLRLLLPLNDQV